MRRLFAALAATTVLGGFMAYVRVPHELPPVIIGTSPGGTILDFIRDFDDLRRSGRQVHIDGTCISACTMVVGLIPKERICVTPFAKLAFHSAWRGDGEYSDGGTRLLWELMPEPIKAMVRAHGWDGPSEHPDLVYIGSTELQTVYAACDSRGGEVHQFPED